MENGKHFVLTAEALILAVPSHNAATMIGSLDAPLATSLKNIYYPPVAEVYLGFANSAIRRPLDGFGFLIPEKNTVKFSGQFGVPSFSRGGHPQATQRSPRLSEAPGNRNSSNVPIRNLLSLWYKN